MGEVFSIFIDTIKDLALSSGIAHMDWKSGIMILISFVFMYLATSNPKYFMALLLIFYI